MEWGWGPIFFNRSLQFSLIKRIPLFIKKMKSDLITSYYYITCYEPRHEISNNVVCATSKGSDQPAHTRSLIRAFAGRLNVL